MTEQSSQSRVELNIPADDLILPFQAEQADVSGRLVKLGPVVDTILSRHAYPEAVSQLLGEAVALPPELLKVASCKLNAALHPDAAQLLETLPLRVPQIFDAGGDRLDPLDTDAELRAFAEEYTREELGGFVCPTDREAWASRWLEAFGPLYAPRHAEQRARLECALDGLLAWLDGVDKA